MTRSSRSQEGEEKKPLTKKSKCLRSRKEGRAERYSNGRYEENEEKQNRKEERIPGTKRDHRQEDPTQASAGSQEKKPETLEQTENLNRVQVHSPEIKRLFSLL